MHGRTARTALAAAALVSIGMAAVARDTDADAGAGRDAPAGRFPAFGPGAPAATVWKGFRSSRHTGLRFEARPAS